MIRNPEFEIVDISGEYMAVPVGETSHSFRGIVALNDASAFLLKKLDSQRDKIDLIQLLSSEFDVDEVTAAYDIEEFLKKMIELGVIIET